MTTRPFLTAQHAWSLRTSASAGMTCHRSVARSSRHTCSTAFPPKNMSPPQTNSPGSVLRKSFAPTRAALHTSINRHAPMRPR